MDGRITHLSFNQDASCIAVGSRREFRIYSCFPFAKRFAKATAGIRIVEMLNCTSLVALFSPRLLKLWNMKSQRGILDLPFESTILAVRLNRQRIVVVCETKIHIFRLTNATFLQTVDTVPNPNGLVALSPADQSTLAFPGSGTAGTVVLYDACNLTLLAAIRAHHSPLRHISLSPDGTLLATASVKGTMLRVFSTPSGERLCSLRRGAAPTCIRSLSFSPDGRFLAVSSDTPTVHIFRLQHEAAAGAGATADAHAARGHAARRPSGGAVETGVGAGDLGSPPGVPLSAAAGAASAPLPIPGAARPSEGGHVVGSWQSAGSWCSELAGTPPTGPRLSRSGSDVDDEAGDVWSVFKSVLPASMSEYVGSARAFAYVGLRRSGVPHMCALRNRSAEEGRHTPSPPLELEDDARRVPGVGSPPLPPTGAAGVDGAIRAQFGRREGRTGEVDVVEGLSLLVVSQDGVLLEYDVNTSEGGECRLLQERLLYDSESEELGVHILPQ